MNAARETPSAADLAFPLDRYTANGVAVDLLKPYWQRNPRLHPVPNDGGASLAIWRDGTRAPVPSDAGPDELARLYFGACILWEVLR